MEKMLLRTIIKYLVIIQIVALGFTVFLLNMRSQSAAYKKLDELLAQESQFYWKAKSLLSDKTSQYAEDCMNKLHGIDFMLANNKELKTNVGMNKIKYAFNVEQVYAFDENGKIAVSSDEKAVGKKLLDTESAKPFWDMIKNGGDTILNFNTHDILEEGENMNFVAMPASSEEYSMVMMGVDKKLAEELYEETTIQNLMLNIPTTNDNAIIAVDRKTGEVLGETKVTDTALSASKICKLDDFHYYVKHSKKGRRIWVGRRPLFMKTKLVDDVIFIGVCTAGQQMRQIVAVTFGIIFLLGVILVVMMHVIKWFFRKYVLEDIDMIQKNVKLLISGDENVHFESKYDTELNEIITVLNDWNSNVQNLSKKLNWIVKSVDGNAGLFESHSYVNGVYFSDNFQSVLGASEVQWNVIKENASALKVYIGGLIKRRNMNGLVEVNGKFLKVELHDMESDFFGIIVDKTEEVINRSRQMFELRQALDASEMDILTELLNRRGFEQHVRKILDDGVEHMIMLMIDVDNFKRINDTMGHPEGDKVLRQISDCLKKQFRREDVIARLGGDEFAVFMYSNMKQEELEKKLQGLLDYVGEELKDYAALETSVSIGAAYLGDKKLGYKETYQCADDALYAAKRAGKNQYRITEC